MTIDDPATLALLRANDQAAWADFCDLHGADIRAFLRQNGGNDPGDSCRIPHHNGSGFAAHATEPGDLSFTGTY